METVALDKEKLKGIRTEIGLTQQQMANFLKVSMSCYCRWEQGRQPIPELTGFGIIYKTEKENRLKVSA